MALDRLWSDQFTVNAPNNEVVAGKRAVLDAFVHSGVINFSSFERRIATDQRRTWGGLVAGQPVQRRFTNVWKKEAGTWRLFARHANVIPTR